METNTISRWADVLIKRINAGEIVRIYGSSTAKVAALVSRGAAVRGSGSDCCLCWTWVGPRP